MAGYVKSAQTGNTKIDSIMNKNLLKVHPDKTGFIVMGCKKYKEKVYTELKENPIMVGKFVTTEKEVDKYLGDLMHSDGLAASVEATVKDRTGKV